MPIRNVKRIRHLIMQLNVLAHERKTCVDRLWELEDTGEKLRTELMQLLDHP